MILCTSLQVFTDRPTDYQPNDEKMKPDLIVEYLQRFPVALQHYLEYLVYDRKFEVWQMFEAFFSQHETTAIALICDVSLNNYYQTHLHSL